ncbi:LLM class flavin-dependent oxidoreductase [Pseudonocardia oroxyli]|uniref:Luciferase-like monooxygenase n=1 Tax=Pseudonocardia oroxyli TaxID=366584 RepID=A0A1G7PU97_PSEOR|nr:LLM class flavin-dependent oxidoreductase [Pseudonocardia oroxyli]SDF89801.1 Luciferase-like monooxygenase [Pseudonocardia oroxyli]
MRVGAYLAHLGPGAPFPVVDRARLLVDAGFESLWIPQIIGRAGFVPDPFVALAAAAVAVPGVEVGTATLQVPLHHPAELAHKIRSLQAVAGERLTLGVSPGSTEADHALLGKDFAARFRTLDAQVDDLRPLGVPLLLGSWGRNVEKAARRYDGWIASAHRTSPAQIVEALARFRAAGGGRAVVTAVSDAADLEVYADAGFDDAIMVFEPGQAPATGY